VLIPGSEVFTLVLIVKTIIQNELVSMLIDHILQSCNKGGGVMSVMCLCFCVVFSSIYIVV
jgi:hypothetical protein